jgi:hypothetical protein
MILYRVLSIDEKVKKFINRNIQLSEQKNIILEQNDDLIKRIEFLEKNSLTFKDMNCNDDSESNFVPMEIVIYISNVKSLLDSVNDYLIDFVNISDKNMK